VTKIDLDREWRPDSWRDLHADQQPEWPDDAALEHAIERLRRLPPLVFAGEARALQQSIADAAAGRAFLLQAGDCAESFSDFTAVGIRDRLRVILQMSVVLTYGIGLPVVKIGRIAGQFGKPRSTLTERIGDADIPAFRGHIVHDDHPSATARTPDPERMVAAYHQAASTLNLLRAFTKGGFADLGRVHAWNQEFVSSSPEGQRYEIVAREIARALRFMTACGLDVESDPRLHEVDLWTSHEALLLPYEEALTRRDSLTGGWYDCSAHMVWLGYRTSGSDSAHVRFLAGVENPIGCKVGPGTEPEALVELCDRLNPDRIPGRLTLIARMGADDVGARLPPLLRAVRESGHPIAWVCDPMHGNTELTVSGRKTRRLEAIVGEVEGFFAAHAEAGTWPGGLHVEITGEDVTECLGGSSNVLEDDLDVRYTTLCDPRLNARQSLDLAFRVAELMRR
jgi:3-deoxy-7-phosphoheptulonate synthase